MNGRLRIERIQWFDTNPIKWYESEDLVYPDCDGAVCYELVLDDGEVVPLLQVFARGSSRDLVLRGGGNAIAWGWDGNREAPTLTPSYLAEQPNRFRVHLFLQAGKISLCSDSTCVVG